MTTNGAHRGIRSRSDDWRLSSTQGLAPKQKRNGGQHLRPGEQQAAGQRERRRGFETDIAGQHQQKHRLPRAQSAGCEQGQEAHRDRSR